MNSYSIILFVEYLLFSLKLLLFSLYEKNKYFKIKNVIFFKDLKLFIIGTEMNPLRAVITVATFVHLKE